MKRRLQASITANSVAADERVSLPVVVPLYVKMAWNRKVPSGERSAVLTKVLCDYLSIPEPKDAARLTEEKESEC